MTPYDQLKKKIQEANPEIMELKFGCEVEDFSGVWKVIKIAHNGVLAWNGAGVHYIYKYKILGRPIRLADVLLAMDAKSNTPEGLHFPEENQVQTPALYIIGDVINRWNLKDDNLDNQSQECKDFLINLLVND